MAFSDFPQALCRDTEVMTMVGGRGGGLVFFLAKEDKMWTIRYL